jgi:hypothetical protein
VTKITAQPSATKRRIQELRSYMTTEVLDAAHFVCSSATECKRSVPTNLSYTEGQLSHIGKHYDLFRAERPLRIVVVGQEVGGKGKPHTSLEQRYQQIHKVSGLTRRFTRDGTSPGRNPHMRGTTLALRVALGRGPGTDHEGEFLKLGNRRVHVFDCFALVNRLLCSAHELGSRGRPTSTMFGNCERHFEATLKILEPTLVIVQGGRVWKRTRHLFTIRRALTGKLLECDLGMGPILVCTFTHPSAWAAQRWDSPRSVYFQEVVEPTLRVALGRH